MLGRLAHCCRYVYNLEASLDYYCKLGLTIKFRFTRNNRVFGAYIEIAPGNFLELFETADRSGNTPSQTHFCLETADIDAFINHCKRNNIATTPKKFGCDNAWQVWLKDLDGNEFEVHQYTENSSQITGENVEAAW
jgi:catechol 2,3-dioxygenase-like lactoylglutathione lyase family enzyme